MKCDVVHNPAKDLPYSLLQIFSNSNPMRFILCFCLAALTLPGLAQKEPSKWKTQNIVVNDPELTVKASIQNHAKEVKPHNELTYAWYKSGKIIETQGGSHGRLLEGPYASFYLNDQLKEKGSYKNGLRHGEWREWDADGHLATVKRYRHGRLHGTYESYDTEGRSTLDARYKKGKLHGETVSYKEGKELSRKHYHKGAEGQSKLKTLLQKKPKEDKAAEPGPIQADPPVAEPKVKTKVKRTRQRTPKNNKE